ncbi:MAG: SWIM zinc finger domain-containing protein [Anaerolineae bacterium]|jgi:uncharacterized Zn finger protein|nr:SWIM zinc finger domain-containing protein [Anaerolineae bacterium]
MKPKNIKDLQTQSRKLRVRRVDRDTLVVESTSNQLAHHVVTISFQDDQIHARCTCPWAIHRGIACSHVMAALEYLARQKGRKLSFWLTEQDAQRQRQRVLYLRGERPEEGVWITSRNDRPPQRDPRRATAQHPQIH